MKVAVFSYREDEKKYFELFTKKYNIDAVYTAEAPTPDTIKLAQGCDCISIITTEINAHLLKQIKGYGIKFISTRTIGYDHIDLKAAKEYGIHVGNVTYSPYSVAEYTVMLILMANRRTKHILERFQGQDYTLNSICGSELNKQTVGVIGTGKIGGTVIDALKGFGCHILAYDLYEKASVSEKADYTSLERLFRESDVITLHAPGTEENYHLIDADTIRTMKDGVTIINTARGSLVDTEALIRGIESGKIGAAALDVMEHESDIYYKDFKYIPVNNRELALLKSFPNVTVMPHTAFYTGQAVSDMVEHSLLSCMYELNGEENPWIIQ